MVRRDQWASLDRNFYSTYFFVFLLFYAFGEIRINIPLSASVGICSLCTCSAGAWTQNIKVGDLGEQRALIDAFEVPQWCRASKTINEKIECLTCLIGLCTAGLPLELPVLGRNFASVGKERGAGAAELCYRVLLA
jgi:hypothetical protein